MKIFKMGKPYWIALGAVLAVALLVGGLYAANDFQYQVELAGEPQITVEVGETFTDPGATGALRGKFFMKNGESYPLSALGSVDTETVGSYTLTYTGRKWKKIGTATRVVNVVDTQPPILALKGAATVSVTRGKTYTDVGCVATDNYDGDLTASIVVSGEVDTAKSGTYTLKYNVTDRSGNAAAEVTRTVTVKAPAAVSVKPTGQEDTNTVMPTEKTVYLTFDDGPGAYTGKLLDVLAKYNVKATFFVIDTGNYAMLKRIVNEGHAIGVHSTSHDYDEIYASEEAFFADLYNMQNIIKTQTGVTTMLTRFPGGSSNTISRFNPGIMSRLSVQLTEKGFRYFDWNVSSGDAGETTSTAQVVKNVKNGILSTGKASVVLQHDIKGYSVNAVEEILQWGLAQGYKFEPVSMTSPTCHHGINN